MKNSWTVQGREYRFKTELDVGDYIDLTELIVEITEGVDKFSTGSVIRFAQNARNMRDLGILALSPVDPNQDPEFINEDILRFKPSWVTDIILNLYSASETLDGAFLSSLEKRIALEKKEKSKTRSQKSKTSSKTSIKKSEAKP